MAEEHPFIIRLSQLVEKHDRGTLANLRRGLTGRVPVETYKLLSFGITPWQEDVAIMLAPLFAYWHQGKDHPHSFDGDLGKSFRQIRDQSGSMEKRFTALLGCHRDDLSNHLRRIISLLKAGDIPVDWSQLLRDVSGWSHPDQYVQRKWARSFWAGSQNEAEQEQ